MPTLNPLLESDNIECAHQGKIVAFSNNKLLEVDGSCVLTKQDLLQAQIIGCTHQVAGFSTPCKAIVTILDSALSNTLLINGDSAIIAQQISQIFTDNGVPLRLKNGATPKAKDIFELDEDIAEDFNDLQNGNENAESMSESSPKSSENLDTKSNEIFTPLPQRYASNDDMAIYEDFINTQSSYQHYDMQIAWGGHPKVSKEFKQKVIDISQKLKIKPDYLIACIAFESAETFSPSVRNPNSSAVGLIQFLESTAKDLGTSTKELAQMTALEQLDYVEKYFKSYSGKLTSVEDVYMVIFYPQAVGKSKEYVISTKGNNVYNQNVKLDTNKDGILTKGEARLAIRGSLKKGLEQYKG